MSLPPIQRSTSLRYLIRDLTREAKFRALQNVSQPALVVGLRPVAALAAWLRKFQPDLISGSTLKIAVVGAEQEDTVDEGRWYGFLGYLVGNESLNTRVTLVGPSLYHFSGTQPVRTPDGVWRTEAAKALAMLGHEKAAVKPVDAAAYCKLPEAADVDLIVLFNPGLEDDHSYSWFESGQLAGLCALGKPMALTAYAEEEQLHEAYLLRAWGFTSLDECVLNPFIGFDTPAGTWSRHLWSIQPGAPRTEGVPDRSMLERHDRYMRIAENVIQGTHMTLPEETGKLLPLKVKGSSPGPDTQGIGLPHGPGEDALVVGLSTGTVYVVHNGFAESIPHFREHPVPQSILAEYDVTQRFRFEHILWAVDTMSWLADVEDEMRPNPLSDFQGFDAGDMLGKVEALRDDSSLMSVPGTSELADMLGGFAEMVGQLPPEFQAMLAQGSAGLPARTSFQATRGAESFFHALETSNWARAAELLQEKPELSHALDRKGANAVMYATTANNVEFLTHLAEAGADFGVQDEELFAPLHEAARRGLVEVASFLLDHGAQPDAQTRYGFTPLLMTLNGRMGSRPIEDFSAIVLDLLAHNADAKKRTMAGVGVADMIGLVGLTDTARKALHAAAGG